MPYDPYGADERRDSSCTGSKGTDKPHTLDTEKIQDALKRPGVRPA